MSKLDLSAVMDALAEAPKTAGIVERAYGWPNPNPSPPAVIVEYPTAFDVGVTFGRANDRVTIPVWLILGKIDDRTTRDTAGTYLAGDSGDMIDALNTADSDDSMESCRVMTAEFGMWAPPSGEAYLAIRFDVDVLT